MSSAPGGNLSPAVFLSYASQDAEAVQRIAVALRAAGIVVWFDKDELVGGDAWDQRIRGPIASCALFVPVVSAATQAQRDGYFPIGVETRRRAHAPNGVGHAVSSAGGYRRHEGPRGARAEIVSGSAADPSVW